MRKNYLAAVMLGTALVVGLATPAQASATGTASVVSDKDGQMIVFKAASGKANRVVISRGSTYYLTIDDRYPIKAGSGCKRVKGDKTKVTCGLGELTERIQVHTYDRGDSVTNRTPLKLIAYGGSDNDTIRGASADDLIYGESGTDTVYGNGGNDKIYGGPGNDELYGGSGNDHLIGGKGKDQLRGGPGADRIS